MVKYLLPVFAFMLSYTAHGQKLTLSAAVGAARNTPSSDVASASPVSLTYSVAAGVQLGKWEIGVDIGLIKLSERTRFLRSTPWDGQLLAPNGSVTLMYGNPQLYYLLTVSRIVSLPKVFIKIGAVGGHSKGIGEYEYINDHKAAYRAMSSIVYGGQLCVGINATAKLSPFVQVKPMYYHDFKMLAYPISAGIAYRL